MATHGYINHVVPYKRCLPKPIEPGKTATAGLPVGEDSKSARSATLRIQLDKQAKVTASFNGQPLPVQPSQELTDKFGLVWLTADTKPDGVRVGQNTFEIKLAAPGDAPAHLTGLELLVTYA